MIRCQLVLASDNPARLAAFYSTLCDSKATEAAGSGVWNLNLPTGGLLQIYRPSRLRPQPPSAARLALCLHCRDVQALGEQALALGARMDEPLRKEVFGAELWLQDPEGNRLLLLSLTQPA